MRALHFLSSDAFAAPQSDAQTHAAAAQLLQPGLIISLKLETRDTLSISERKHTDGGRIS